MLGHREVAPLSYYYRTLPYRSPTITMLHLTALLLLPCSTLPLSYYYHAPPYRSLTITQLSPYHSPTLLVQWCVQTAPPHLVLYRLHSTTSINRTGYANAVYRLHSNYKHFAVQAMPTRCTGCTATTSISLYIHVTHLASYRQRKTPRMCGVQAMPSTVTTVQATGRHQPNTLYRLFTKKIA